MQARLNKNIMQASRTKRALYVSLVKTSRKVTAIMHTIDTDGSGSLSVDEFLTAMQNDRVEHALRQIGVDIRMPEHYFKTLAAITEQEEIAIDEFVAHIVQMKGAASRTDVQTLTLEVAMLQTHGCKPP